MKVLIVDDDVDLLDVMTYALRREGYEITCAADGLQALDRVRTDPPDLVVLDLGLPRLGGFEVCRRIRHASTVPIIMVTAKAGEQDVLRGLRIGADDYMTKPFSLKQLAARIETVLRRCQSDGYRRAASEVRAGDLLLRLQSHEVTRAGLPVQLTPLEFRILFMLAMNEGQIIPYARLVDYAWGYEGGDANLLKTHICHIRQKLSLPLDGDGAIRSLPTVGYTLVKRRSEVSGEPLAELSRMTGAIDDDEAREDDWSAEESRRLAVV
ncbi:MAG: response regulator transcription factor [Chloroflexi bacterium]|nr:response regulator transcription factor [Chloroflexota bacterium]